MLTIALDNANQYAQMATLLIMLQDCVCLNVLKILIYMGTIKFVTKFAPVPILPKTLQELVCQYVLLAHLLTKEIEDAWIFALASNMDI